MEYFVYIYNSEDGIPYYVGKGSRQRVFMRHEIPVPCRAQIQTFAFATEQEAWDTEIDLIALFKRKCDGGTLLNLSTGGAAGGAGITHSQERRKHMSDTIRKRIAKLGHPQQGRRGARSHNSLIYLVTTPDNTEVVVKGITQFCRDNNLTPSAMVAVAKGRRLHHKGYKCSRIT